jgi:ketosteroid isomerase-like protein
MNLVETTKSLFAAFDRGDKEAIIGALAPDVQWEYGPLSHDIPWYQNGKGHDFVRKFLDMCYRDMTWQSFTRSQFFVDGNVVVVLGDAQYTIKNNDRKIVYEDVVFLFHFNESGKVEKFAHRNDTHQAWLAYHNK